MTRRGDERVESRAYRWVIVAAGGLLGCMAIGALFSLPVFLQTIARDTGWSITGISTAMTMGFLAMAVASMAWGTLSDRIGTRPVVLTGSVLLAASLALASRAGSLIEFQLLFGVVAGIAAAAVLAPMMACVTGWIAIPAADQPRLLPLLDDHIRLTRAEPGCLFFSVTPDPVSYTHLRAHET